MNAQIVIGFSATFVFGGEPAACCGAVEEGGVSAALRWTSASPGAGAADPSDALSGPDGALWFPVAVGLRNPGDAPGDAACVSDGMNRSHAKPTATARIAASAG